MSIMVQGSQSIRRSSISGDSPLGTRRRTTVSDRSQAVIHRPDGNTGRFPAGLHNLFFSLAGQPFQRATRSFAIPEYATFDPDLEESQPRPIWSLTRSLSRIVRLDVISRPTSSFAKHLPAAYVYNHNSGTETPKGELRTTDRPSLEYQISLQHTNIQKHSETEPLEQSLELSSAPEHLRMSEQNINVSISNSGRSGVVSHKSLRLRRLTGQRTDQSDQPQTFSTERLSDATRPLSQIDLYKSGFTGFAESWNSCVDDEHVEFLHSPVSISGRNVMDRGISVNGRIKQSDVGSAEQDLKQQLRSNIDGIEYPVSTKQLQTWHNHKASEERIAGYEKNREESVLHFHNAWAKFRYRHREPLAEFLGAFVLMTIGLAVSVVQRTGKNEYGNFITAALGWGFGAMMGIHTCGGVSGAHLNPAVTIMLVIYRGFSWRDGFRYVVAQFFGCACAAAVVFGLYHDTIIHVEGTLNLSTSGSAFYTQPQDWITNSTAFFTEAVATGILACCILALNDERNAPPGAGMNALVIGLLVSALCMAFAYNTGACLNPIRDFAPRLVTFIAGYSIEVFTVRRCWWLWIWGATISGALVGALVYDLLIFTGKQSPVNYPTGYWKDHIEHVVFRSQKNKRLLDETVCGQSTVSGKRANTKDVVCIDRFAGI